VQVAHEARAVVLARVTEREPQAASCGVAAVDDRVEAARAARAQALLALTHERGGDATTAVARIDGEAKEATPPAVPHGDQRPR
jgi:hypothetical protein